MKNEVWRDIEGYNGYQVSSYGRVKSLKHRKERLLKPKADKNKYQIVVLYKNNIRKDFKIHRLVAKSFLPNPNCLPELNHKDEDKTNNNVDNLEWCDRTYNINYGTRTEKYSKPVLQFDKDGNFLKTWNSIRQVERELGISSGNISKCCKGKYKSAGGYIWKYKEKTEI